jgi:predicted aconitase
VCAAITGRVPYSGLHVPENRKGTVLFEAPAVADPDPSYFTTLGYLVGKRTGTDVPVVDGLIGSPSTEALKSFSSTVAAAGPVGMFHMVGTTPEAHTLEAAFGGRRPKRIVKVTKDDLRAVWEELSTGVGEHLQLVLMGSPMPRSAISSS